MFFATLPTSIKLDDIKSVQRIKMGLNNYCMLLECKNNLSYKFVLGKSEYSLWFKKIAEQLKSSEISIHITDDNLITVN
jgi:hypothetical protein